MEGHREGHKEGHRGHTESTESMETLKPPRAHREGQGRAHKRAHRSSHRRSHREGQGMAHRRSHRRVREGKGGHGRASQGTELQQRTWKCWLAAAVAPLSCVPLCSCAPMEMSPHAAISQCPHALWHYSPVPLPAPVPEDVGHEAFATHRGVQGHMAMGMGDEASATQR